MLLKKKKNEESLNEQIKSDFQSMFSVKRAKYKRISVYAIFHVRKQMEEDTCVSAHFCEKKYTTGKMETNENGTLQEVTGMGWKEWRNGGGVEQMQGE